MLLRIRDESEVITSSEITEIEYIEIYAAEVFFPPPARTTMMKPVMESNSSCTEKNFQLSKSFSLSHFRCLYIAVLYVFFSLAEFNCFFFPIFVNLFFGFGSRGFFAVGTRQLQNLNLLE